jgi:predicted LPLAT superfamily acyltransferase
MTWKGKTRGGTFGYLFFIYLINYLGITTAYIFLCLIIPYFIISAPKATKSVWFYSRRILKYNRIKSAGMLFRNYYRLGQILIDKIAINGGLRNKYQFEFNNYPQFLDILHGDQGVIMIGAHVGNWEAGSPFFHESDKTIINIVMYDAEHQGIKKILEKNGLEKKYKFITVNEDNLKHVFKITEALGKKEHVCFQGDRYLNKERVLTGDFMGRKANFPEGPFLLAARIKAPVVFYFAMRESNRTYRFYFTIAKPVIKDRNQKPEQILFEQYIANLQQIVTQYPEQWFNYYKFWN